MRLKATKTEHMLDPCIEPPMPNITATIKGRKPLPPENRSVVGSIRLTPTLWGKFTKLGGINWLRVYLKEHK